jgi:hypothetical protein
MSDKRLTEITVRWSWPSEKGVIPPAMRARLLEAAKSGDMLVLDLLADAIREVRTLYSDAGYDPRAYEPDLMKEPDDEKVC